MRVLREYQGTVVRLTEERLAHILEHPEMRGSEGLVEETLLHPQLMIQSVSDEQAKLYYRYYVATRIGDKFLCVVVKVVPNDAFVVTAYFTDKPKKGAVLWSARP